MTTSRILTIEQVAVLLNVRESWIYQRTGDGSLRGTGRGRRGKRNCAKPEPVEAVERIPHFKAGRLLRFDEAEVLAWFAKMHRNGAEPSVVQPEEVEKRAVNQ
ncbi:MAG: helix-turn-helix domain-containing protein [Candidatus Acidiferrales bacterium]